MSQNRTRSRVIVIVIVMISVLPMLLAWWLHKNPQWLESRANNGQLIIPVITTERPQWLPIDEFSRQHKDEIKGRWVLLNLIPNGVCGEVCQQALHKTKQLRLMLNKDLTRVRRVAVSLSPVDAKIAGTWGAEDDNVLLRMTGDSALLTKLKIINGQKVEDGVIVLMDPLGNLMMIYEPGFDPYLLKKDLKKLLRASQIG